MRFAITFRDFDMLITALDGEFAGQCVGMAETAELRDVEVFGSLLTASIPVTWGLVVPEEVTNDIRANLGSRRAFRMLRSAVGLRWDGRHLYNGREAVKHADRVWFDNGKLAGVGVR